MYLNIQTERLLIRSITPNDDAFILNLVNSKGWLEFIGDRKIVNTIDAKNYIQKILDNPKYFYSVFIEKKSNLAIGIVTFLFRDSQNHPDIGFAILPEYANMGYTYEASKKYLNEISSLKICTKVIGITKPTNVNSIKLLKRLGLKFEKEIVENDNLIAVYSIQF